MRFVRAIRARLACALCAALVAASGAVARTPPLADRLPADTLVYAGAERPLELAAELLRRAEAAGNPVVAETLGETIAEALEEATGRRAAEFLPLLESDAALAVFPARRVPGLADTHTVLLLETGPSGSLLPALVDGLLLGNGDEEARYERIEVSRFETGIVGWRAKSSNNNEAARGGVYFSHAGDHAVFGDSKDAVRLALDGLAFPPRSPLSEKPAFARTRTRVGESARVFAFVNIQRIAASARMEGDLGRRAAEAFGLDTARSLAAAFEMDDREATLRLLIEARDAPSGLLAAVTPARGGLADPGMIPAEVGEFWTVGMRPVEMWRGLVQALEMASPMLHYWHFSFERDASAVLGEPFDFERDVIGVVGESAAAYRLADAESPPVVMLALSSRQAFDGLWAKAGAVSPWLAETARSEPYLGHTVTVFEGPPLATAGAARPGAGFSLVANRLVFSSRVGEVQRHLRFVNADGRSLATRRAFRRAVAALPPGQWGALYYADSTGGGVEGLGMMEPVLGELSPGLPKPLREALQEALRSLGLGDRSAASLLSQVAPVRAACATTLEDGILVVAKGLPEEAGGE